MSGSDKFCLHIVAFDIPYPPNYGGVIDVYYKVRQLHALGAKIVLHAWQYGGREPHADLVKYCYKVNYYPRQMFKNPFLGNMPYIVKTRNSKHLNENLKLFPGAPVLFEGLHTTAPLYNQQVEGRRVVVRNHNIEQDYYKLLSEKEKNPVKKQYLKYEAGLLETYSEVLKKADVVASISPKDQLALETDYNSVYVPAFHPNNQIDIDSTAKQDYFLYHGNLAVAENNEAALFLVKKVFAGLEQKLVVAGNKAGSELEQAIAENENVQLKEHLSVDEFHDLIKNAQANVLPTFQATGIKLKLLNALFNGRHCIVNNPMIELTGLAEACTVCNSADEFRKAVVETSKKPFTKEMLAKRKEVLADFDNKRSAKKLWKLLFD